MLLKKADPKEAENSIKNAEKEKHVQEFILQEQKYGKLGQKLVDAYGTDYTRYATYVPVYPQITAYYCGPATALQTIYNWHYSDYDRYEEFDEKLKSVPVSSKSLWWYKTCCKDGDYDNTSKSNWAHPDSTEHTCYKKYTDQQVTLADDIGTTMKGSSIYDVRDAINKYVPDDYYGAVAIKENSSSKTSLKRKIKRDLNYDHAVVFLVQTKYLDRYKKNTNHFISGWKYLDYEDFDKDKIGLADCHYDSTYGGKYTEDFNDVFKALYEYYNSVGVANLIW